MNKSSIARNSGARTIRHFDQLTSKQQRVVWRVLLRISELAQADAILRNQEGSENDYRQRQFVRRPQNVFLIDGARGSGKTTTVLTIWEHLKVFGVPRKWRNREDPRIKFISELEAKFFPDKGPERKQLRDKKVFPDPQAASLFLASHQIKNTRDHKTAFLLPMLFPSDLEKAQPVMEGIFAGMAKHLDDEIDRIQQKTVTDLDSARIKRLKKLNSQLRMQVVSGWYSSKQEGQQAILQDSFNYEDYLERRGKASGLSYSRVGKWREFVNEFLDEVQAQLLVVFLDDTDVSPSVNEDILMTIRIFLDHPRIATVIAGNIRSMRQSLLLKSMAEIQPSIQALSESSDTDAHDWRRNQRRHIEEYIDKVLPRRTRYFLRPDRGKSEESDFKNICGDSFEDYCLKQLDRRLASYCDFALNEAPGVQKRGHRLNRNFPGEESNRLKVEHFMSWWLFWTAYRDPLWPRSIRQIETLWHFTSHGPRRAEASNEDWRPLSTQLKDSHNKRLPVILFEAPDNFALVHRFGDGDHDVHAWLRRQTVCAHWRGERHFQVNDRKLFAGEYSFDYVCYRLDLAMCLPTKISANDAPLKGVLPQPAGPNLFGRRPFFSLPEQRPHLMGVARVLGHSLIPANCLCMMDLMYLPDVVWVYHKEKRHEWGNSLTYTWHRFFLTQRENGYFAFRLPKHEDTGRVEKIWPKEISNMFHPLPYELVSFGKKRGEKLKNTAYTCNIKYNIKNSYLNFLRSIEEYWAQVVIPIGSLEIGWFIPPEPAMANPDSLKGGDDILLNLEIERDYFDTATGAIEGLRREYDYLGHLARSRSGPEGVASVIDPLLKMSREIFFTPLLNSRRLELKKRGKYQDTNELPFDIDNADLWEQLGDFRKCVSLYAWLVNHVRRAWHAGRIFVGQLRMADAVSTGQPPKLLSQDDVYSLMMRHGILQLIFNRGDGRSEDVTEEASAQEASARKALARKALLENEIPLSICPKTGATSEGVRWARARRAADRKKDADRKKTAARFAVEMMLRKRATKDATFEDSVIELAKMSKEDIRNALWNPPVDDWTHPASEFFKLKPRAVRDVAAPPKDPACEPSLILVERAALLYVWALSPSLPALAHLEISGLVHGLRLDMAAQARRKARLRRPSVATDFAESKEAKDRLDNIEAVICATLESWRALVIGLRSYVTRKRAAAEYELIRLALIAGDEKDKRDKKKDEEEKDEEEKEAEEPPLILPRFPDIGPTTLGLSGPAAFLEALQAYVAAEAGAAHAAALAESPFMNWLQSGCGVERPGGDSPSCDDWCATSGIFKNVDEHLRASLTYLEKMDKILVQKGYIPESTRAASGAAAS